MQFFKISLSQVIVAGLLVTSAAGAPLPLSGDLAIRDDFSVAGVNGHLDARDPSKFSRFVNNGPRKLKPLAGDAAHVALDQLQRVTKREPEPKSWFNKAWGSVKSYFKSVGKGISQQANTNADGSSVKRDVILARDPSKIGNWFKKLGKKVAPIANAAVQTVLPGVEIGKRDVIKPIASTAVQTILKREPEPEPKSWLTKTWQRAKNLARPVVEMTKGALGYNKRDVQDSLMARDVDESAEYAEAADALEARDVDEHWE